MPHDYQQRAISRVETETHLGLFLDMGLGKTVITLTAVNDLIYDSFEVLKVLVIAPKMVARDTWSREAEKWDHLKNLRVSKVMGTPAQRIRALEQDADIYVLGRDSVVWLVNYYRQEWPFDMVVIDELSSFKNPQAKRFRALRKVMPYTKRVVGLTGTPSPNGLMDLWAEVYLLDQGKRLGKTISAYREQYFRPGAHNGYVVYRWTLLPGVDQQIRGKLSDICVSMSAADYLTLPERIDNVIPVKLTPKEMDTYKTMERDALLEIEGEDVAALNAAAAMNKLLQIANGRVYSDAGTVLRIHDEKLDALEEIADTGNVLVFYSYKHDLAAIKARFPSARQLQTDEDIRDWNNGDIPMLLAHPASVGYGLNLQAGGHIIVWYGLTWSLELYQQANARLHRQGQQQAVIVHHLIAEGTVDEQVMRAMEKKDTSQRALLEALKERRQ